MNFKINLVEFQSSNSKIDFLKDKSKQFFKEFADKNENSFAKIKQINIDMDLIIKVLS